MRAVWLSISSLLVSSACYVADPGAVPSAGEPCAAAASQLGEFVCEGGVWRALAELDMKPEPDMRPPPDMRMLPPDMKCAPEDDATLCAATGLTCGPASAVDRCGESRELDCGGCPDGEMCNALGLCVCAPRPCPDDVVCGKVSDGCGARRLCDACEDGFVCDPDELMCIPED